MKNCLLIGGLSLMLFLGACGNEEPAADDIESEQAGADQVEESSEKSDGEAMSREEFEAENAPGMADTPTEERDYSTATEDVIEFIEYNDTDILVDEVHDYLILERYEIPEVHESGRNRINFNGFKQEFGLFLVEDSFGYRYIFYGGEHINDAPHTVNYYGTMSFITDLGEQVDATDGMPASTYNDLILEYEPGVKRTGFTVTQLENDDETPEEIRVIFGNMYYDEGDTEKTLVEESEATFYRR